MAVSYAAATRLELMLATSSQMARTCALGSIFDKVVSIKPNTGFRMREKWKAHKGTLY